MLDLCLANSLEWSRCFLHLIWVAVINSLCSLLAWKGHWYISLTLISLDGIGILIAPVAKWVRCSTIGKLAQALRNFACAERREGIYCSSFAHLCLHPLMLKGKGMNARPLRYFACASLWVLMKWPTRGDDCHGLLLRLIVWKEMTRWWWQKCRADE